MRGIATGANEFFFLTESKAAEFGIPGEFLLPAVGRTRDVTGERIDATTMQRLRRRGRPTLLLSLNGRPASEFPAAVQKYIARGESMGIHRRTLIALRRPWYKMEVRAIPPVLFAYLGRRNARFIHNEAGVVPLTGFLCVYPKQSDSAFLATLWGALSRPDTIANLALIGKSYGSGAIKVEPRALERLPIPDCFATRLELGRMPGPRQLQMALG
jgi:hypothetical protein